VRAGIELAATIPARGWQRRSCANGSKGERPYDRALADAEAAGQYLVIRRSLSSGELAYYRCWSPAGAT
jgi:hypothetical protein